MAIRGGEPVRARYVLDCSGRNSLIGTQFGLKKPYAHLQKFSVYAHYENVDREPGIDGTLIRVIRGQDRWFWMIPLSPTRMSIGVVLDSADFKKARKTPERFLEDAIAEQPVITERTPNATRATPVYSTGDYSYRNERLAGGRWLLAGDAAGFIDPVFSTGVFLAMFSGEKAADALEAALKNPAKSTSLFAGYEKAVQRVMNRYLRFVTAWYSQEFIEIFVRPEKRLQIPQAVNSVLGGNLTVSWGVWWRMELFYLLVKIHKRHKIVPPLDLTPGVPQREFVRA